MLRAAIAMQHELAAVGLDLKALMQCIADRTRELTGGDAAAVRLLDGNDLVCGATSGAPEIGQPHRLPVGNNLTGHAMRSRRSLLCMDAKTDERVDSELARRRNVRSIIAVPLLHAGRIYVAGGLGSGCGRRGRRGGLSRRENGRGEPHSREHQ